MRRKVTARHLFESCEALVFPLDAEHRPVTRTALFARDTKCTMITARNLRGATRISAEGDCEW